MNKLLFIPLLFLFGCATEPEVRVVYRTQVVVCEQVEMVQTRFLPVVFEVATTESGRYVLGLDGVNYSNLALNVRNLLEYTKSQKAYNSYLLGCIERHNAKGPLN